MLGEPREVDLLYLEDCDPKEHTTLLVGSPNRSFSPGQASSIAFVEKLLQSDFYQSHSWTDHRIEITVSRSSVTDEHRLETFEAIARLSRPEN